MTERHAEPDVIRFSAQVGGRVSQEFCIHGDPGDHIIKWIRSSGTFYELELLETVASLVRPGGCAVDVGANIGNHTLYLAGVLGMRVVCVEPFPRALALLRKNLQANGLDDVCTVIASAAGAETGCVRLAAPDANLGMARVVDTDTGVSVPCDRLDNLLQEAAAAHPLQFDLIKIDVEGFESNVIAGAQKTLREHHPLVVVEAQGPDDVRRMDADLVPLGYSRFGPWCATPTWIYSTHPARVRLTLTGSRIRRRLMRRGHGT